MKRTTYLYALVLLLAFAKCKSATDQPTTPEATPLQNVLLIISDDHAAYALGCYGNEVIRTPNLDRLASEGTRFERAFCNAPMCTASRASFITGKYAHATGTTLLHTPLPEAEITLADHLKTQGYATGSFGKNHFNSGLKHGYDTLVNNREHQRWLSTQMPPPLVEGTRVRPPWKPFRDHARTWLNAEGATSGLPYEMDQGTFFARAGIDFMRQHKADKFFTVVSFREPHSPFNFPVEFTGKYNPSGMGMSDGLYLPVNST
ncbi:MAG: sulfatase-like hydrolase/transferase, partial [Bacteroidota bacterium]